MAVLLMSLAFSAYLDLLSAPFAQWLSKEIFYFLLAVFLLVRERQLSLRTYLPALPPFHREYCNCLDFQKGLPSGLLRRHSH